MEKNLDKKLAQSKKKTKKGRGKGMGPGSKATQFKKCEEISLEFRKKLSDSQKGNQSGVKIKDPDLRQKAYDEYCKWLSLGKTHKSFTFVEGELWCTSETMKSYIKNFPAEFDSRKEQVAYRKGYAYWESVVEDSAKGINKDASTATLNMLMRNKFKWDKEDKDEEDPQAATAVKRFDEKLEIVRPTP